MHTEPTTGPFVEWLNISTSFLRSEEFLGCEPIDRATWMCLANYCATQENGGVIPGCATWGDRKWQQVCGVTKEEAGRVCPLWGWAGNDLVVEFYPVDQEEALKAKRTKGRNGGTARTAAKTDSARRNGAMGGRPKTQAETQAKTEAETQPEPNQNPREGKEKKSKESETQQFPAAPDADDMFTPSEATPARAEDVERYQLVEIANHGGEVPSWFRLQWSIVAKMWGLPRILETLDRIPIKLRNPKGVDAEIRKDAEGVERPSLVEANKFAQENADYLIDLERQIAGGAK